MTGQHLEKACFAASVYADKPYVVALVDEKTDVAEYIVRAEGKRKPSGIQKRHNNPLSLNILSTIHYIK